MYEITKSDWGTKEKTHPEESFPQFNEERFAIMKGMHEMVLHLNDENAYYRWISLIPDGADDEELRDCANDPEIFDDACRLFERLLHRYLRFGLYFTDIPSCIKMDDNPVVCSEMYCKDGDEEMED